MKIKGLTHWQLMITNYWKLHLVRFHDLRVSKSISSWVLQTLVSLSLVQTEITTVNGFQCHNEWIAIKQDTIRIRKSERRLIHCLNLFYDSPLGPICSFCLSPRLAPWVCDPPPSSEPPPPSPACPSPPSAPGRAPRSRTPCRTDDHHKAPRGNLYLEQTFIIVMLITYLHMFENLTKLVDATVKNELLINARVPERLLLLNDLFEVIPVFKLLPMELRELFLRMGWIWRLSFIHLI